MARYLVTGGDGFVGANFVPYLLNNTSRDTVVVNIDKLIYGSTRLHVDDDRYFFYKVDLNDAASIQRILERHNIDTVVHLAAQTHVDISFRNSLQFTKDNILGTHTLLESCRSYGKIKMFLHFSTDEVYGEVSNDHKGCVEGSLLNPTNPYSATKTGAEFLVRAYAHSFNFPNIITRANNIYGPLQFPDKIIPLFSEKLMRGEKCDIHGDGSSLRSFIHVHDVCLAIWAVLQHGKLNEIYNIGSTDEISVLEIHDTLMKIIRPGENASSFLNYVEDRPFNDRRYAIDMTKLQMLGWERSISFEQGLNDTVQWYMDNPNHFETDGLRWVVFGHSGRIGEAFCDALSSNGDSVIRAEVQADNQDSITLALDSANPDRIVVISDDSIFTPLMVKEEAQKRDLHMTYIHQGQVQTGIRPYIGDQPNHTCILIPKPVDQPNRVCALMPKQTNAVSDTREIDMFMRKYRKDLLCITIANGDKDAVDGYVRSAIKFSKSSVHGDVHLP